MDSPEEYMSRCLELARLGLGNVSPNPMVGSVIVHNNKIIGEGFHQVYGGPHAEVNAINAVKDKSLLKESIMYVSLEPCAHYGFTPPCSDLIIEKQIPKVVIGTVDPFAEVAGKGIEKLRKAGVAVVTGILEKECQELNKRFFTYHQKQRPYIILKWAQTADGFIDKSRDHIEFGSPTWITGDLSRALVHKIRSEEDAIMVGTNTAKLDNPSLTVRNWSGRNPLRVVIDRDLKLSPSLNLFDGQAKTLIFNLEKDETEGHNTWIQVKNEHEMLPPLMEALHQEKVQSLIVEGGTKLLESFIWLGLWDEMHVFTGNKFFGKGVYAPKVNGRLIAEEWLDTDHLRIYYND